MNAELKRTDFVISIVYGYLLVFAVAVPISFSLFQPEGLKFGVMFGVFSLLFGAPIALVAFILGFPVFRASFARLRYSYFTNVMLSCCVSALITAAVVLALLGALTQGGAPDYPGSLVLMGAPILPVAFISGLLFWQRTK